MTYFKHIDLFVKFLVLLLIGACSVFFVTLKDLHSEIFTDGGRLTSTEFQFNYTDTSGRRIFSITPLNDYFYKDDLKDHVLNKISLSETANNREKIEANIGRLFFGEEKIVWKVTGDNSQGQIQVIYEAKSKEKVIEIDRKLEKLDFYRIGSVINYCEGCFVGDDKGRIFFNGELLTEEKIRLAERESLVPVVLGENQSLPIENTRIRIIDKSGRTLFETERKDFEIYLQEQWHLLEFKGEKTKQVIYLK